MTHRITFKDVKDMEEEINKIILPYSIIAGHRYDYIGIDLYKNEKMERVIRTTLKTKEAYVYLEAFLVGLSFAEQLTKK